MTWNHRLAAVTLAVAALTVGSYAVFVDGAAALTILEPGGRVLALEPAAQSRPVFAPDLEPSRATVRASSGTRVDAARSPGDRARERWVAAREDRSAAEVLEVIAALRESQYSSYLQYQSLLVELASLDTPEALDALAALMADESFDFPYRAKSFAEALRGVDEPRFAEIASLWFERGRAAGELTAQELSGYLSVIARNGGPAGARKVIDLLSDEDFGFQYEAGKCVAELNDARLATELFELVTRQEAFGGLIESVILKSMAAWHDPRIQAALWSLASDATSDDGLRKNALEAFASQMNSGDLAGIIGNYRFEPTPQQRRRVTAALSSAARGGVLSTEDLSAGSETFLRGLLAGTDEGARYEARQLIQSEPELCSARCRAEIERLSQDTELSLQEREEYRYLLSKL